MTDAAGEMLRKGRMQEGQSHKRIVSKFLTIGQLSALNGVFPLCAIDGRALIFIGLFQPLPTGYWTFERKRSVTNSITTTIAKMTRIMVEAFRYWNRSKATLSS